MALCKGITKYNGEPCIFSAVIGGLCIKHYNWMAKKRNAKRLKMIEAKVMSWL